MTNIVFLIKILILSLVPVHGTHFLGGTITWHPLNPLDTGSPVAIVITQTYSWTSSIAPCTSTDIANSNAVPFPLIYQGVTNKLNCALNCATASGYVAPAIWPDCTDVSTVHGTTVGQRSDIVRVPRNADFTVAFAATAWRPLATQSAADWSLASRIKLTPRSDNGLYNNAPVATVMSPINIPQNKPTAIHIPIRDADGDVLRCRWASGTTECGDVCPPGSLPSGTLIFPNCTIIITGTVVGTWYAVTVQVEDFINSSSTTPLSSVPVQFLVHVVAPPACAVAPDVYELSRRSCTPVTVGQTFTSRLIAINNCGSGVSIVEIATLSFAGMVQSIVIKQDSLTYYKTLTWTPTTGQLGFQVMCAMAIDSQHSQSAQYCFTFYVSQTSVSSCPGDPTTTSTSTTTTTETTTTRVTTTTATTSTTSTTSSSTSTTSTATTRTTSTTSSSTSTTSTSTTSTTSASSTTSATSTTSTSTTSTSSTSTTTTSVTTASKKPDSISWPLIGTLIGLALIGLSIICCCLCWHYCCIPASWRIHEENGPFELYHIDRCTDPECQWLYASDSPNNKIRIHNKKYLVHNISSGTITSVMSDPTASSDSQTRTTPCSNCSENDFRIIDYHFRPKSIDDDNVFVTKVRGANNIRSLGNVGIKSPCRKEEEDDNDVSVRRLNSGGTVRVTRVKSSARRKSVMIENKRGCLREEHSMTEPKKVIRVPPGHSTSEDIIRPSIIANTIQLDEYDRDRLSIRSLKKSKNRVRVKHVVSSHRTSAIEPRFSQIDVIELSEITTDTPNASLLPSSVRVERVRTAKKKAKSGRVMITFESILEEAPKEKIEQQKRNNDFGVVVERIPREKSTKSIT